MTSKSQVSTTQASTAVALPDDLLAQMAVDAKATSALERPSVSTISLRAGMLSLDGDPVKGNKLAVVVLFASHLNTYYGKAWDPDNTTAPDCFALSVTGNDMAPHENVASPIHDICKGCPNNEWGSDIRDGKPSKGKACKETRRLVLIPASALASGQDVANAELAMVRLPVTSVKEWGNFVNTLDATLNLPYYAVVTDITTKPDIKTQFKVVMTPTQRINDVEVLRAIMRKRTAAEKIAMLPYDPAEGEEESTTPGAVNEKF